MGPEKGSVGEEGKVVGSLKMVMVVGVEDVRVMICWRWEGVGGKMANGDPGVRGGGNEKLPEEVGV